MDRINQRWLWAAGAIVGVAALALLVVVFTGGSDDDGLLSTVDDTSVTTIVGSETTSTTPVFTETPAEVATTASDADSGQTDVVGEGTLPGTTISSTATSSPPTSASTTAAPVSSTTVPGTAPTLWDLIAKDPDLAAFKAAIQTGDLVTLFDGPERVTAFIPSNDAFQQYLADTDGAELLPDDIAQIVRRHVVTGELSAAEVFAQKGLTTLSGEQLLIDPDAKTVDGAALVRTDLRAVGGVMHVVDAVLMPTGT